MNERSIMSNVDIERCSTYGYVKTLTVHVNAEVAGFLDSEMKIVEDENTKFAYEYALDKVQHAHGNGRETCDIVRHKFLMSFAARISPEEQVAISAWNQLCKPFTS